MMDTYPASDGKLLCVSVRRDEIQPTHSGHMNVGYQIFG